MAYKRILLLILIAMSAMSMSVLNAQVEAPKEVRGDEEYINWNTNPIKCGISGFKVHPNGNIIANHDNEFFEISGTTGELIRAFPVQYNHTGLTNVDISSDGKYFLYTLVGGIGEITYVIDYQSGEIKLQKKLGGSKVHFTTDSKMLATRPNERGAIEFYDFEGNLSFTKEIENYDFEFSPDEKYIITRRIQDELTDPKTLIELWDAKTFQKNAGLLTIIGKDQTTSIQFSSDGKYVGVTFYSNGTYIFSLADFKLIQKYPNYYVPNLCFLNKDLIGVTTAINGYAEFVLLNIFHSNYIPLFSIKGIGWGDLAFNNIQKSIIVNLPGLTSLNLEKILSKVSVEDIAATPIQVKYNERMLTITNLNLTDNNKLSKIIDMQGNVVFQFPITFSLNYSFSIPISLPVGAYILQIEGLSDSYKFLVTE